MPLGDVATVEEVSAQGSITRIDEAPAASISAEIASEDTGKVSKDVQAEIDALVADGTIPQGVDVRLAGVTQQQSEAFGGLFVSMGVAVLVVYVAMVLTFNSLITPFIILFSLPLATIGAFPALYVTGRPLGVSALIGFLMLIGIVVTNAIVLLDLVERLRVAGHVHQGGPHRGRTDPRPADPHDGDRDDPRADPARRGLQPGLDHRGGARHGRHRRPVQLHVPHPPRHPGGLLAGGRGQGPAEPEAVRRGPAEPAAPLATEGGAAPA